MTETPAAGPCPVERRMFAVTAEVIRALHGLPRVEIDAMQAEAGDLLWSEHIDD